MKSKEILKFEARFQGEVQDILVVTGASGVTGGKVRGEKLWTASIDITAWQPISGGKAIKCKNNLAIKVDDEGLGNLRKKLQLDSIAAVRVKMGDRGFMLMDVLDINTSSSELETILVKQRKDVIYEDDFFGKFKLDRSIEWFEKEVDWLGTDISLNFDQDTTDNMKAALNIAKSLFSNQQDWDAKIRGFAASELLELKNDNWLEDKEEALTAEAFAGRITLESVQVDSAGGFEFWFGDDDIFWGHSVRVCGNIKNGPAYASMEG